MSAAAGRLPRDPALPTRLVLPVGHRLGPLFDVAGQPVADVVVRRGAEVVHLLGAEAQAWLSARPAPGPGRAGDVVALERRLHEAGVHLGTLDRLTARGLLVDLDPAAAGQASAGIRARPLGSAQGGATDRDAVALGALGTAALTLPGRDLEVWTAAVGAPDLWTATALLAALWSPERDDVADDAARLRLLELLWRVVPAVLAGGCGYLDTAG